MDKLQGRVWLFDDNVDTDQILPGYAMAEDASKLAAFAIVIRLLVDGLLPLALDWQQMLAVLAVGSLLVGNLAAIAQTNLKRMLAYSTISQMGFVLLGLMSGVVSGHVDASTVEEGTPPLLVYREAAMQA